jgi:tetratricopeptide (TPR) repeat protein
MRFTALLMVALAASPALELADELATARRSWDVEQIMAVHSRVRSELAGLTTEEAVMVRVSAGLAAAEVLRVGYEESSDGRDEKGLLGDRIDAVAKEALEWLDRLPESSERERIRADLLATMIRSDYRAKKLEPELRAAVDRALALDPDNPMAHTTAAKPLLFAPVNKGRDIEAAMQHLDRALTLEPGLESARLLRASARETGGDLEGARSDARAALAANPDCAPAIRLLERLGEP